MKAFIIASEKNLDVLRNKLLTAYPTLTISGTNNVAEGIKMIVQKHVIENYDVVIVANQNFVATDIAQKHELSKMINTSGLYSAKDLPIYFMVNETNEEYYNNLKKLITNANARIFPYKELTVSEFEQIIKEVGTYRKGKPGLEVSVEKEILNEKMKHYVGDKNSYRNRIFTNRTKEGQEDYSRINKVREIFSTFKPQETVSNPTKGYSNSEQILSDIKTNLFSVSTSITQEESLLKIQDINDEYVLDQLKTENASETLRDVSPEYDDYMHYMDDINELIEAVKKSDSPDKVNVVIELMKEKAIINNNSQAILAKFITQLAESSIQHITETYNNDLAKFSEISDLDELVGGKLNEIKSLKENRNRFKKDLQSIAERMHSLTAIVRDSLSTMGKTYQLTSGEIRRELIDYANENNVIVKDVVPVSNNIMQELQESYNSVNKNVNALINVSNVTVKNFMELVMKDEEIIEKQDEAIDILMTHRTKKIIVMDNIIQVKSTALFGADATGKTHSALNLAHAYAKYKKVLYVDLNINNPSTTHYNKIQDASGAYWVNSKTITLENFITLPINNKLGSSLPHDNNLTIIQPSKKLSLTAFERTVAPELFIEQLVGLIKCVADFYDNIFFVLPENLKEMEGIFKHIGRLILVTDVNPNTFSYVKEFSKTYSKEIGTIQVKHLFVNKQSKGLTIDADFVNNNIGVSLKDFAFVKIPLLNDSPTLKIEGKIPYLNSNATERYFDSIVKNL